MPYADPEVRRVKGLAYSKKWASKPEVRARRNEYERERRRRLMQDPSYAEARRAKEAAYRDATRQARNAKARQRRENGATQARDRELIRRRQQDSQAATQALAQRGRQRWSPDEDALVLRGGMTHLEMALALGRTYNAVAHRRVFLRKRAES